MVAFMEPLGALNAVCEMLWRLRCDAFNYLLPPLLVAIAREL